MLTRQSFAAALEALGRMLSNAGRAATRLLWRILRSTPGRHIQRPRLVKPARCASSRPAPLPAQRARAGRTPVSHPTNPAPPARKGDHALRGEYREIRVSEIGPAAKPSRLVYDDIDRLAASIAGGSDREGFGLLAPVVVRLLDNGGYEIIDGDRRLRACRLIAAWSGAQDCLVPAYVFRVSACDAQLMRIATLDVQEPTPIELARIYQALRDVIAGEGSHACSARGLTLVGHHGKTQIAGYIRIADAITDDVMVAAGLVTSVGKPAPEVLVDLTRSQLLDAAKGETVEARAAVLKGHHDRQCGRGDVPQHRPPESVGSPEQNGDATANTKVPKLSLIARSRTMPPSEARELIESEMAPAMIALVEQAHGGRDAEGYYSAFTTGHACLVLPRAVEGLTLEQLDRLDHALGMLAARTRRAREELLNVDAMFAPLGEKMTS
jgi:hypothetical protein